MVSSILILCLKAQLQILKGLIVTTRKTVMAFGDNNEPISATLKIHDDDITTCHVADGLLRQNRLRFKYPKTLRLFIHFGHQALSLLSRRRGIHNEEKG
jgi:hypothetical protein